MVFLIIYLICFIFCFMVFKENKGYMFNRLKNKKINSKNNKDTSVESKTEKNILNKIDKPIHLSEYAQYTVLDYSIRILSYPEEKTRYYAVISLTGGQFKDNIANLIISYNGGASDSEKNSIWNYSLINQRYNDPYFPLIEIHARVTWNYTFDAIKDMLNKYIKNKNNGEEQIGSDYWKAYSKDYAYYFDTKEDALYAICQFKKVMDERFRKGLYIEDNLYTVSETEIKVTFTD